MKKMKGHGWIFWIYILTSLPTAFWLYAVVQALYEILRVDC